MRHTAPDLHIIRRYYPLLGIANLVVLGAFALIQSGRLPRGLIPVSHLDPAYQLNLADEQGVVAVWYSSALALLIAVVAVVNYEIDRAFNATRRGRATVFRYGWLLLAAASLFYSVDESAQIHEGIAIWISNYRGVKTGGLIDASPVFLWLVVLGPPIVLASLCLLGFFAYWLAMVPRARWLASAGIACWAIVPLFEFLEARLLNLFGDPGVALERFFEESLEIMGTTLLLIGALEYLIARASAVSVQPSADVVMGRASVVAGCLSPLALIPLAFLAVIVDPTLGETVTRSGYYFSAARIARVMDTVDQQGHHLILSDSCDLDSLRAAFPYEVREGGQLATYPPAGERRISPPLVLTVLDLGRNLPAAELAPSLTRVAMLSTHLWYLDCGGGSAQDRAVTAWLDEQQLEPERLWLPGVPPVVFTRVAIKPPLVVEDHDRLRTTDVTFGDALVALLGYDVRLETGIDQHVLRVSLLWEALQSVGTDYHVFVHLIGPDGALVAQSDGVPFYDRFPISAWQPFTPVLDVYDVAVPPDLSETEMEVRVGLYDYETGERLKAGDSDYVRLAFPTLEE